jgi:uncharacterized protein with HEPN domain
MTRAADERIRDILAAVERCISYRDYLDSDHSTMAYDAILRNLAVIGEAVRAYLAKSSRNIPTPRGHRSPGCGTSLFTSTSRSTPT